MSSNNENRDNTWKDDQNREAGTAPKKETTTLNLDTGEVEPLEDLEDKNVMDFASGSGGGSATDGAAS
jgi:hypothetical protein